jgi:type I restriction enzyme S subunit
LPYGGRKPEDGKYTTLGDVCTKITDGSHYSPVDDADGLYPMYSVKDMETYDFNPYSCKHIAEAEFQKMICNDCVP